MRRARPYVSDQLRLDVAWAPGLPSASSPRRRGEFRDLLKIDVGQSGQHCRQVLTHGNLQPHARFHDRQNRSDLGSSLWTAHVDAILSSNRDRPHRVLRDVVAQLEHRVLEKAAEPGPQSKRVFDRLAEFARRQCADGDRLDRRLDLVQQ